MSEREATQQPPEAGADESRAQDAAGDGAAAPVEEDELTRLRREVEELKDKLLRQTAELQNSQRRAARDRAEALRYAEGDFARDLLVILDDLERTQESARTAPDVPAVADGVRIVYEHFLKVLAHHEIHPIEAVGKPFDPTYHEAMMQQPSADYPPGTVLQEIARGYTMHERVLRPTRVIVSAAPGGPDAASDGQFEER